MTNEHVVCVPCGAINRLPTGKDATTAKCGSCGATLFFGPAEVSAEMLERQIGKGTLPVVVDIWAPWCGPCLFMGPEYEKASRSIEPSARFLKLNSDSEQQFSARMGIRGIPTMILFMGGREVGRTSGAMGSAQIERWVRDRIDG